MTWEVEFTDEFEQWWDTLDIDEQKSVAFSIRLLESFGPTLDHPYTSQITTSKFGEMRELRAQHRGNPYRVLYAFDPRRVGMLLIGGNKIGNDRWYEEFVPKADRIYARYLEELKRRDSFKHGEKVLRALQQDACGKPG